LGDDLASSNVTNRQKIEGELVQENIFLGGVKSVFFGVSQLENGSNECTPIFDK